MAATSQRRQAELEEAVRGRLAALRVSDLSEETLQAVLSETAAPDLCLRIARDMVANGLTAEALRTEFGPWTVYHAEIEQDKHLTRR